LIVSGELQGLERQLREVLSSGNAAEVEKRLLTLAAEMLRWVAPEDSSVESHESRTQVPQSWSLRTVAAG
jgi:hypothetical protein